MPESRYNIIRFDRGFFIDGGRGRCPVYVRLAENDLGIEVVSYHKEGFYGEAVKVRETPKVASFGFPEFVYMHKRIANRIMLGWEKGGKLTPYSHWDYERFILTPWAVEQTRKALGKRVKEEWLRLKSMVDPKIIKVQNMLYSASLRVPEFARTNPDFYNEDYIIGDILKYRAARAIASNLDYVSFNGQDWDADTIRKLRSTEPRHLLLRDWMNFYSPTFEPYPALRKTLMNIPGNFPAGPLQNLKHIHLREAVKGKNKLLALCALGGEIWSIPRRKHLWLEDVIYRSSEEDFIKAYNLVRDEYDIPYRRYRKYTKGYSRVRASIIYLSDYNELRDNPNYTILGLANRAIEWHTNKDARIAEEMRVRAELRQLELQKRQEENDRLMHTATALPPIDLPNDEHVIFLDMPERIIQEGKNMGHCVASYAIDAVKGQTFIFHIEYRGERATVAVNPKGRVSQARGPKNVINKASEYGKKVLAKWGQNFPGFENFNLSAENVRVQFYEGDEVRWEGIGEMRGGDIVLEGAPMEINIQGRYDILPLAPDDDDDIPF